jgi:hypothetical protein
LQFFVIEEVGAAIRAAPYNVCPFMDGMFSEWSLENSGWCGERLFLLGAAVFIHYDRDSGCDSGRYLVA